MFNDINCEKITSTMMQLLAEEKKKVKFRPLTKSSEKKCQGSSHKIQKRVSEMNLNVTPDYSVKSKSRAGSAKRSKGAEIALKKAKDDIKEIRKSREDHFKKIDAPKKIKISKVAVKPRDLDLKVNKD
jgi:hypothetical protein